MTTEQATTGGTGGAAPAWFDALDAETKGYVQNRGLDKKTPTEAFLETARAHREAEKLIGAPANELLRLPKDPNAPEWAGVHQRLGKPKEATEYDFSSVKRAGDKPLDPALADTLRKAAFDGNMTKEAATRVAAEVAKHLDGVEGTKAAETSAQVLKERETLKANWGVNEAANMVVARAAATALGVKPEAIEALEKQIGYAQVMDMFRNIGTKIGEARFITPPGGGADGVMTRDQAVAEKSALKADSAWVTRYLNGGREEKAKMEALERIIVGVSR